MPSETIAGASTVPIPRNGLACSLVLKFGSCSVVIEDSKFECVHHVGIWPVLDSLPDLREVVFQDA